MLGSRPPLPEAAPAPPPQRRHPACGTGTPPCGTGTLGLSRVGAAAKKNVLDFNEHAVFDHLCVYIAICIGDGVLGFDHQRFKNRHEKIVGLDSGLQRRHERI